MELTPDHKPTEKHMRLVWRPVAGNEDFSGPEDWIYETEYRGVRLACGYNDGGPVAWVGHPTEDKWIDSVACDGTFESGAKRAAELADEILADPTWWPAFGRAKQ